MTYTSRETPLSTSELTLAAIGRAQAGSWTELVARCDHSLRALLANRLRDAPHIDAEDVRQEAWAEALRGLSNFECRGPGSFYAWLAGIARNKLFHAMRRSHPVTRADVSDACGAGRGTLGLLETIDSRETSVGARIEHRELAELVRQLVGELPADLREVVRLRIYEGCSGRETAKRLGVHESTVSVRLKLAFRKCRRALETRVTA